MVAEETKVMWRQLRTLNPTPLSGLTMAGDPRDCYFSTQHCKDCHSWSAFNGPHIRQAFICRNRLHFGQVYVTFPTIPPFTDAFDWTASKTAADDFLQGTLPFADEELDETANLFLHQFRVSTALNSVSSEVTASEWVGKMKVWRETTTTSPSGIWVITKHR
jgi:hypothetical protein